jgi:hypothetical protein
VRLGVCASSESPALDSRPTKRFPLEKHDLEQFPDPARELKELITMKTRENDYIYYIYIRKQRSSSLIDFRL